MLRVARSDQGVLPPGGAGQNRIVEGAVPHHRALYRLSVAAFTVSVTYHEARGYQGPPEADHGEAGPPPAYNIQDRARQDRGDRHQGLALDTADGDYMLPHTQPHASRGERGDGKCVGKRACRTGVGPPTAPERASRPRSAARWVTCDPRRPGHRGGCATNHH